jgi:Zn-dependent M28 family amino/carboxypeptidase
MRGECEFGYKSVNAGFAGARGLVIVDNIPEDEEFHIKLPKGRYDSLGPLIPTISVTYKVGMALQEKLASGKITMADRFFVLTQYEERFSHNIIATTRGGDQNNIVFLGAHTDSVEDGPGMNDNGSGSATILEIAMHLGEFAVKNAVRFGWWTFEEVGGDNQEMGSEHYVESLSADELMKIRMYLNFDMLGSGNGIVS